MIHKLLNRFSYLNALVQKRATGTPSELARKLGLSERGWYKLRDELVNDLGVPLAYDAHRQTYYYTHDGALVFQFRRKLDTDSMQQLEGGRSRLSVCSPAYFMGDGLSALAVQYILIR